MSETEWTPRPYVVGEENVYVVGIQGTVEAICREKGRESVTINGYTLPRVMGNGVRYMSMIWPEEPNHCDREHVDDSHSEEFPERESLAELVDLIRERHEQQHSESQRFCNDSLCRAADSVNAVVLS